MKMKNIKTDRLNIKTILGVFSVLGVFLAGARIIAGQVISLQQGQTYVLENGDVVACVGGSGVIASCRLVIDGMPPFHGIGQGPSEDEARFNAEQNAQKMCHEYVALHNISFLFFDGCVPGPANTSYHGCDRDDPSRGRRRIDR